MPTTLEVIQTLQLVAGRLQFVWPKTGATGPRPPEHGATTSRFGLGADRCRSGKSDQIRGYSDPTSRTHPCSVSLGPSRRSRLWIARRRPKNSSLLSLSNGANPWYGHTPSHSRDDRRRAPGASCLTPGVSRRRSDSPTRARTHASA